MEEEETKIETRRVLSRFKSETGEVLGNLLDLPINTTVEQLQLICNAFLQQEENIPYVFFVKDKEISESLDNALKEEKLNTEEVLEIVYQQQAIFRVRAVTRCTSSIPGHSEAVISVSFSPDGSHLASGSGDMTVRFWDVHTQTPLYTCRGHKHWVLCISWSPNGKRLASACKNGEIILWDPETGTQVGKTMRAHKQWVTALAWEPLHRNAECRKLASSSKDGDIRIWDVVLGHSLLILTSHTMSVTCMKWGGTGLIYSGSQDRTIKVWRADDGVLCRTLEGHAHWVNTLALNTDYVMRTGSFDPVIEQNEQNRPHSAEELKERAAARYSAVCSNEGEYLLSGSDDFTLFLWHPEKSKKPVARLLGHQQLVNDVKFSPDGRLVASASFDKSVRIWDGKTGKFITTLRGHIQAVYMVAWSADSRLLVSGSRDSTLKVWNMSKKQLEVDLPGHADEVFAVDWSPDGVRVASGGRDKVLKLWQY